MLVESYNRNAALAALNGSVISTRLCVTVQPGDEIMRFVKDNTPVTIEGVTFEPVPYAIFDDILGGDGGGADTTTIVLDGADMVNTQGIAPESILHRVLEFPLRDRPIQIGLLVLDPETQQPIGLIPRFVGFIDNAPFTKEKEENTISVRIEIQVASFRAFAQRRFTRTYSDSDHRQRFTNDGGLKWLTDAVFRNGKYPWNSQSAIGSGSNTGASVGGRPADTSFSF